MTLTMTRRVTFSSGHRAWDPEQSGETNREIHGPTASPYNHGHDFILDLEVSGPVDPRTGMIVNIKRVDDELKAGVLAALDHRSLNDEVPGLDPHAPTTERLAVWIEEAMTDRLPSPAMFVGLVLQDRPGSRVAKTLHALMIDVTRTYEFAAAHRLHAPDLGEEENERLYGKCHHAAGHGHNYTLEVTVDGPVDARTGRVVDPDILDEAVTRHVMDRFDHRNLDVDVAELSGQPSTSENVAVVIFNLLRDVPGLSLKRVRLWETPRNAFTVERSS